MSSPLPSLETKLRTDNGTLVGYQGVTVIHTNASRQHPYLALRC